MKKKISFTTEEVKSANRKFYDLAYRVYEKADGRRGEKLGLYLDRHLSHLSRESGGGSLLDLGCGSGFAGNRGRQFFARVTGVDLSPNIIKLANEHHPEIDFIAADSEFLPFRDNSFDGVVAVALLHHLLEHHQFFAEVFRVLKPGGVLYTDHDLERRFRNISRLPLALYRLGRDEEKRYRKACPQLTRQLYMATEIHREGLNPDRLIQALHTAGFGDITVIYHWLGLSPVFDRIGHLLNREGRCPRGFAPSLSIWARK